MIGYPQFISRPVEEVWGAVVKTTSRPTPKEIPGQMTIEDFLEEE